MKKYTKTYKRFIRKVSKTFLSKSYAELLVHCHGVYKVKGKLGVVKILNFVNVLKTEVVSKQELDLPPSMPKSAREKIYDYIDERSYTGEIFIHLHKEFVFENNNSWKSVKNVKEAIAAMRVVKPRQSKIAV